MKKLLVCLLAFLTVFPTAASAQTEASVPASDAIKIMPVPPDSPANLFGQNHYYTITLRGNGEAVVTFKAILSNTGTTPLETVSLQLPENVSPADIIAYQVKQEPQCIRYLPYIPRPDVRSTDPVQYKEECAEYQKPDYQYVYGNTTYHRIQNETQNNTVLLKLPLAIEPNENGSYFVYFRSKTVVQKDSFGAYNYDFKTFKTEDKIHSLQVGISTDDEYILRGVKGEVNYAPNVAMASLPTVDSMERGVKNAQFDQFYNQIGSGKLIKQASDLAPLETYEVKGSYAQSQAKLYGKEIATGAVIILIFVIIAIVVIRISLKKLARKKADKPEDAVVQLKNQNKTFLIALSISFLSMLLVCLYTFGVYAITQLLSPNIYYSNPNDGMILSLFIFAISGLVYLFFFFAPAVGMAIKKGLGWGLVTFSATVVWAILFLLVLFALLFFFIPRGNGYPQPYPLMGGLESRVAPAAALDLAAPAETSVPGSEPQTLEMKSELIDVQPTTEPQKVENVEKVESSTVIMDAPIETKPAVRAL